MSASAARRRDEATLDDQFRAEAREHIRDQARTEAARIERLSACASSCSAWRRLGSRAKRGNAPVLQVMLIGSASAAIGLVIGHLVTAMTG